MEYTTVRWAGVNHLALITNDMDSTTRFWHGVLGAPLVATLGNESFRHYFFKIGEGSTVAFFEYQGHQVQCFAKPAGVPDKRAIQFDHLSLNLADEETFLALRQRLVDYGCEVTEVIDHGLLQSIYFNDPNGIALEASWWVIDPTRQTLSPTVAHYTDPQPVPAAQELQETGNLEDLPQTNLVDAPTGDIYHTQ